MVRREDWAKDDEYFADNMRRRREDLGWTQGELSRRLQDAGLSHMHQTTVSRMEKGDRPPRVGEARGIAAVLDVSVARLIAPPEGAQVWTRLGMEVNEVDRCYEDLTRATERLDLARKALERALDATANYEVEGWYAANIEAVRRRARAALKWLTIDHAVEDRHRDDEEMYFEQYRQEI